MHPLLASRARLLLYLTAWLPVMALLAALDRLLEPRDWQTTLALVVPLAVVHAFVCLSAWWVCRAAPLGRSTASAVLSTVGVAALLAGGAWMGLAALWRHLLEPARGAVPLLEQRELALVGAAGVLLYLFSAVVHYLILAFEDSRAAERRTLELQVQAREAELRALRAQVDPHFLFNSLNSISALVVGSPEGARQMCQRLGEFLRSSQRLGSQEWVSLAEELALAERYLAIEHARFGARLEFEQEVAPEAEVCLLPPLLLQPLVENAVRHGVAPSVEGGVIRIEARRDGDRLEIELDNPFDPSAPPSRGSGLGLANVRARLDLLDPRRTRVDAGPAGDRYRVRLVLPALERGAAPRPEEAS